MLERPDVDFHHPRAGALRVDEQADVDAVAVLEGQLQQQRSPRRDDAAQGLAQVRELGEEDLQHRLGRELGDTPAAAAEAGLDEVSLALLQRAR